MSTKDKVVRLLGFAGFCGLVILFFAYPSLFRIFIITIAVFFVASVAYSILFGKE